MPLGSSTKDDSTGIINISHLPIKEDKLINELNNLKDNIENQDFPLQNGEIVHLIDFDSIKESSADSRRVNLTKMMRISEEKVEYANQLSFSDITQI